jgi:hypothetical protein
MSDFAERMPEASAAVSASLANPPEHFAPRA